ncbi:LexA family transcriptional regulator [Rhizobium sp. NLR22b]|uniref:LexA family protein n=1 Tax=Rhizobium sp. NLR22b TaxID=2731115 RepID=UPI001C839DAA|nr:MarR family transcriptional regulator [Rhizobium sp. NLR22b]MBX5238664.1 helix-turn-helix domain-containing protein [Rhizobium sp. NLR22b]
MTDITAIAQDLIRTDPALAVEVHRLVSDVRALDAMNKVQLPARQREALQAIRSFIAENECSPSLSELADRLGLASRSNVHRMVVDLEKRGLIKRSKDHHRVISVVEHAA